MDAIVIRRLRWNDWNVGHIALHGVTREMVEAICAEAFTIALSYEGRVVVVGPYDGRLYRVVLAPEADNVWYCVTAHQARKPDERRYVQEKGSW